MIHLTKDTVTAVNTGSHHAAGWVCEAIPEKTLRLIMINQIATQEEVVGEALRKLLDKYEHAHRLAIATRPNDELDAILLVRNIGKEETK